MTHEQNGSGRPSGNVGNRLQLPPNGEAGAWVDWIGSRQCHDFDEAARAFIQSAFAAGFEAGWRQHLLSTQANPAAGGADKDA